MKILSKVATFGIAFALISSIIPMQAFAKTQNQDAPEIHNEASMTSSSDEADLSTDIESDIDIAEEAHGDAQSIPAHNGLQAIESSEENQAIVASTTFDITRPSANVAIETTNQATGAFKAKAFNISTVSPITKIEIPVWSNAGGQDDLIWYPATKQPDGTYSVDSSIARHKYTTGAYTAHVYITCANGTRTCVCGTTETIQLTPLILSATPSQNETFVTVKASGNLFSMATSVRFPTWSDERGQDDLIWHRAQKQQDGSWSYNIPISSHKSTGCYQVHAYVTVGGRERIVASTTFDITRPMANVNFSDTDNAAGTFKVRIDNINVSDVIKEIQLAIWSSELGQDDLRWYVAQKQSDGTYIANISAQNHHSGQFYCAHAYATTYSGIRTFAGGKNDIQALMLNNYISIAGKEGSGSRTFWIMNPPNATSVKIAVWSNARGQDDVTWHNASSVGGGLWKAVISTQNFKDAGDCTYHLYINNTCILGGTFTIAKNEVWNISGDPVLDNYLRDIIARQGADLYSLYRYVASYPYYRGSEDPGRGWSISMAKEMYQRGGGNCYRYAALFGWLARAAGYDASICSGGVKLRKGGYDSHAWVEIHTPQGTFICDPEEQHAYPQYNWYWQTYSSAHFTYKIYFKE